MKQRTNKRLTMEALAGHFLERGADGALKINEEYLNHEIILTLDNEEPLYRAMIGTRRRAEAVAWEAFAEITAYLINVEYYMEKDASAYYATSAQLKAFLDEYGRGYESIAESVQYVRETRAEIEEERKREKEEQRA